MSKKEEYVKGFFTSPDKEEYIKNHSNLPGPRGNLELLEVIAEEGTEDQFRKWSLIEASEAPVNDPGEFLAMCGIVGLNRFLSENSDTYWELLAEKASDIRWRVREAVAISLQHLGDRDMELLLRRMDIWAGESLLMQRAAMAALCEPRLLKNPVHAGKVLDILDRITLSLTKETDRKQEPFRILRQALGYGWSVAIAALPEKGMPLFNELSRQSDKDIRWIVQENRKKKRVQHLLE